MVLVITHSLQLCARWQLTFIHPVQMAEQDPNLQKLKSRHRPPDYLNSSITRQDKPYSYPVPTCPHAGPHSACPWPGRSSALAQARPAAPAAVPRGRTRRRRGRGPPPSAWSHGTRRPAVQPGCAQLRAGRRTPQGPVVTAGWQAHCDQDCSCVLCAEYWKAQH